MVFGPEPHERRVDAALGDVERPGRALLPQALIGRFRVGLLAQIDVVHGHLEPWQHALAGPPALALDHRAQGVAARDQVLEGAREPVRVDLRPDREAHQHVVRREFRCGVVCEPHQELPLRERGRIRHGRQLCEPPQLR